MVDWDTLVMKILPGIENEMTRKIFNVNVSFKTVRKQIESRVCKLIKSANVEKVNIHRDIVPAN